MGNLHLRCLKNRENITGGGDSKFLTGAACDRGYRTIEQLLQSGADVNWRDATGATPLTFAAYKGHVHLARLLIKSGADVNLCECSGQTALMVAAWNGHPEVVKLLIKSGADVNQADNQTITALVFALGRRDTECVNILLKAGADVNINPGTGETNLMAAACLGHVEMVRLLLKSGAKINVFQPNALTYHITSTNSRVDKDIVRMLYAAGEDFKPGSHVTKFGPICSQIIITSNFR